MNKIAIVFISLLLTSCYTSNVGGKNKINKPASITFAHEKGRVNREGKVVIAVIDTGFDEEKYGDKVSICKDGHLDMGHNTNSLLTDNIGHGTHVAGLIAKNISVPYCIVVIKYYELYGDNVNSFKLTIDGFKEAVRQNVDIINYSGGGVEPGDEEEEAIRSALDKDIVIIAAAGNEGRDITKQGYYPAVYYEEIIVVGNLMKNSNGKVIRAPNSNYGKQVDVQVFGTNIESINGTLTGTSQSTAIVTGRLAKYVKSFRATELLRKYEGSGTDSYYSPLYKYMRK